VTSALTLDALRAAAERVKRPLAEPLTIDPALINPGVALRLPPDATVDVLAGVEVRVSPYVDGVPLATRCRLAAMPDSPTGGVILVTAAELAVMREAFAAPAHNPGARVVATGGGR